MPDTDALRFGKEFGNRGQCNPTYFTVGNLVKELVAPAGRREAERRRRSSRRYVFLTAGACGPCRFGTYVTEYRKALRDAGFDGFRVLLFQQQGGLRQATGEHLGLELSVPFFIGIVKSMIAGDVLNLIGYRIRPYETEAGRHRSRARRVQADRHVSVRAASAASRWRCGSAAGVLSAVEGGPAPAQAQGRDHRRILGDDDGGDGNYRLQRFLESEGAEVDIQPITAWLLYNIWEHTFDTKQRMTLRHRRRRELRAEGDESPRRSSRSSRSRSMALRRMFDVYARAIGLGGYHLSDMEAIATISHQYYDNHLRGGEGHMEVGKLIQHVEHKKTHMVISVKPFGCMPSSGVSDGVQSLVTAQASRGHLLRDRNDRGRRGERAEPRPDGSVQGTPESAEGI